MYDKRDEGKKTTVRILSEKQTAVEFFKTSSHNSDRNCILTKQPTSPIDIYNDKRKEGGKTAAIILG